MLGLRRKEIDLLELALHKDVNELVLQSGHDSVDTMWRNYHKGVTEKEAKNFWAIRPAGSAENVIPFATTVQA